MGPRIETIGSWVRCGVVVFCLLTLSFPPVVHSEKTRLEDIKIQISSVEQELKKGRSEQKEIEKLLTSLKRDKDELEARKRNLEQELIRVSLEYESLKEDMEELNEKRLSLWKLARKRVRSLYTSSALGSVWSNMLTGDGRHHPAKNVYLVRVRQADEEILELLREVEEDFVKQRDDLHNQMLNRDLIEQKLNVEVEKISANEKDLRSQEAALKSTRAKNEGALRRLRAESLRLEAVLQSITDLAEPTALNVTTPKKEASNDSKPKEFQGPGLKGPLKRPCSEAKLLVPFGKKTGEGFRSLVAQKGWELQCVDGAVAIAPGQVLHAGPMPGLDSVVILNHGKRQYSLYGYLSSVQVKKGSVVEGGERLGKLGSQRLHFEIRLEGSAVDPSQFVNLK